MSKLIVDNINVRTSNSFGLRDIQFEILPGELIGVIGPNGAGKSTLAKTIVGLITLLSGDIKHDGQSIFSFSSTQRATLLGYLPQHASFSWELSVDEAVKLGRVNHPRDPNNQADLDKLMNDVGLSHLQRRSVTRLSGGEQMRVHLARLFYGQHKIMILDEPCASLDVAHQHQVLKLLKTRLQEAGALVILHDFSLAQNFCDKLLLLSNGEIKLFGKPEEILESPVTAQTFGVDFQRYEPSDSRAKSIIFPSVN